MECPIWIVENRFSSLELNGHLVKVDKKCKSEEFEKLHEHFLKVDPNYDRRIRDKSQLTAMLFIKKFIAEHVMSTPYYFRIQKCSENDCSVCKPISTQEGKLEML